MGKEASPFAVLRSLVLFLIAALVAAITHLGSCPRPVSVRACCCRVP